MTTGQNLAPEDEQFCQLIAQGNSATKAAAEVIGWPKVLRPALATEATGEVVAAWKPAGRLPALRWKTRPKTG
mgnify:CR=1 FL=1